MVSNQTLNYIRQQQSQRAIQNQGPGFVQNLVTRSQKLQTSKQQMYDRQIANVKLDFRQQIQKLQKENPQLKFIVDYDNLQILGVEGDIGYGMQSFSVDAYNKAVETQMKKYEGLKYLSQFSTPPQQLKTPFQMKTETYVNTALKFVEDNKNKVLNTIRTKYPNAYEEVRKAFTPYTKEQLAYNISALPPAIQPIVQKQIDQYKGVREEALKTNPNLVKLADILSVYAVGSAVGVVPKVAKYVKSFAIEPIVTPAVTKVGQALPQQGIPGRISRLLYSVPLGYAATKSPTFGTSLGIGFGKQAVRQPAETVYSMIAQPEYLLGGIAGARFARATTPIKQIKPENIKVEVLTPSQRQRALSTLTKDFSTEDLSVLSDTRNSVTRIYRSRVIDPATNKPITFEIFEIGKFKEGTNIPAAGSRYIRGIAKDSKGRIIPNTKIISTIREGFDIKTETSKLITEAVISSRRPVRGIRRLFPGSNIDIRKNIITEEIEIQSRRPLGEMLVPAKRTITFGKRSVTFRARVPAVVEEVIYKSVGKIIEGKPIKATGREAEILFEQLASTSRGTITRAVIPTGYKITKFEIKPYGTELFTTLEFSVLKSLGKELPPIKSVSIRIPKSATVSELIDKIGPSKVMYQRGTNVRFREVGQILSKTDIKNIKSIKTKIRKSQPLTKIEENIVRNTFKKLSIAFTRDNVTKFFNTFEENKPIVIKDQQIAVKSTPSQSLYYGQGMYERTQSEYLYGVPAMQAPREFIRGTLQSRVVQTPASFLMPTLLSNVTQQTGVLSKSTQQMAQAPISIQRPIEALMPMSSQLVMQIPKTAQTYKQKQLQKTQQIQRQVQRPFRPIFITPRTKFLIIPYLLPQEETKKVIRYKKKTKKRKGKYARRPTESQLVFDLPRGNKLTSQLTGFEVSR